MLKKLTLAVAVVGLLATAALIIRSRLTTDETRVRRVVRGLIADLERDNVPLAIWGIRASLSPRYVHRGEAADLAITRDLALAYVHALKESLGYTRFKVDVRQMSVTVTGDTARVDLIGRITAQEPDAPTKRVEVMTEPGRNRALIDLAKEDGSWTVVGSERLHHQLTGQPNN